MICFDNMMSRSKGKNVRVRRHYIIVNEKS